MKIALFHTTLPEPGRKPGGVEVAVHRLATSLAARPDAEPTVYSLSPAPAGAPYDSVHLFPEQPELRRRLPRLTLLPALLNRVDFGDADVLHLHGDDWFFSRRPVPSVRTMHGSAREEARTATSWRRKVAQTLVYPLERRAARLATLVLAVGPRTAEIYGADLLADNGVDPALFHPGAKAERPTVLFVGTWEGRKRGRFLYETFLREVLPRVPEARLVMVSDECPGHPAVEAVAFPDDAALAALYRRAWVFAYPSVYEGFGIPYLEAMASGTALVASPNDGAAYVLGPLASAVLTDDDAFGDRLVHLLCHSEDRSALARQGLGRARGFSWAAVAEAHMRAYGRALAAAPSPLSPALL